MSFGAGMKCLLLLAVRLGCADLSPVSQEEIDRMREEVTVLEATVQKILAQQKALVQEHRKMTEELQEASATSMAQLQKAQDGLQAELGTVTSKLSGFTKAVGAISEREEAAEAQTQRDLEDVNARMREENEKAERLSKVLEEINSTKAEKEHFEKMAGTVKAEVLTHEEALRECKEETARAFDLAREKTTARLDAARMSNTE
ncbi:unnamed protein product [Effrenium voratum]|uniref:Uncharacterized protein n=1 Tax=Effrenium voratum TaxID=2562239 RepID=A0AA36MV22_9DINO|nr:unnamed protein product [Effrenium voratum]